MFRLLVALILGLEMAALAVLSMVASGTVVLLAAAVIPLTLVVAFVLRSKSGDISYKSWRITPERITSYETRPEPQSTPEEISRSIVERAAEIKRAMTGEHSEVQVEMCALGYRACANDMITLTHIINEELPSARLLRRMKLHRARRRATDALGAARQTLPPGALRATHQEQQ